ncbi:MAG: hypothetical protein U0176_10415 [Bacteroidia bacterium]
MTEQKDAPPEPPNLPRGARGSSWNNSWSNSRSSWAIKEDNTAEEEVVEDGENAEAELIREVEDESLPPEQAGGGKNKDEGGDRDDAMVERRTTRGSWSRDGSDDALVSIEDILEALEGK